MKGGFCRAWLIAMLAAVTACSNRGSAPETRPAGEIRFSVLSTESTRQMSAYWRPILADMQKQTGLKVTPYYSSNYTLLVEAMRYNKTDAGWFSNQSGLEAVRRAGGEVFARTFDPSGVDGYTSVIIVNSKSKLTLDKILSCDKTVTFGLGDALSTSGTLAPLTYLFSPRNIKPTNCFKQLRSGLSHQTNLVAVANGQLDAATNNSTSLLLDRQNGGHLADSVRVVWRSPVLPEDPIIWRKSLDPDAKEKLRQFFLTYGQGDSPQAALQRSYLAKVNVGGFKAADNNHLLPVREMEATEKLAEARDSADPAKITKAQAILDGIRQERLTLEARTQAPAAAQ